jgi:hypothetical protein
MFAGQEEEASGAEASEVGIEVALAVEVAVVVGVGVVVGVVVGVGVAVEVEVEVAESPDSPPPPFEHATTIPAIPTMNALFRTRPAYARHATGATIRPKPASPTLADASRGTTTRARRTSGGANVLAVDARATVLEAVHARARPEKGRRRSY